LCCGQSFLWQSTEQYLANLQREQTLKGDSSFSIFLQRKQLIWTFWLCSARLSRVARAKSNHDRRGLDQDVLWSCRFSKHWKKLN
jgi:hypothetical protein